MTIDEIAQIFFTPLYQRTTYATEYCNSIEDVLAALCPDDLVYFLALGAQRVENQLNIQPHHSTHKALSTLVQEAVDYSSDVAMPLWTESNNLIGSARIGKNVGNAAGQIFNFNFGEIIGQLLGLHLKGGPSRGDHLFYNLDIATRTLIDKAKRRYFNDVEDALRYDFM